MENTLLEQRCLTLLKKIRSKSKVIIRIVVTARTSNNLRIVVTSVPPGKFLNNVNFTYMVPCIVTLY